MANSHRRRNFIKKIKINGIWFEEETAIRKEVAGAFKDFLSDLSFKEIEEMWLPN